MSRKECDRNCGRTHRSPALPGVGTRRHSHTGSCHFGGVARKGQRRKGRNVWHSDPQGITRSLQGLEQEAVEIWNL